MRHAFEHSKKQKFSFTTLLLIIPVFLFSLFVHSSFSHAATTVKAIDTDLLEKQISDTNNKVLIVDFWATWCSPCKKQLPVLSSLYDKYKSKGVSIIGVAMDYNMKDVKKFVKKTDIDYPVYLGDEDLAYIYKVTAVPTMHIYDGYGNLVKKHTGFANEEELVGIIDNILTKKYAFNNTSLKVGGLHN